MTSVEVLSRDEQGNPKRLAIDNGFCQYTKDAGPEDSYVDKLLNPDDFLAVQMGSETLYLIRRINRLEKEVAALQAERDRWQKACGF